MTAQASTTLEGQVRETLVAAACDRCESSRNVSGAWMQEELERQNVALFAMGWRR